LVIEAHAVEDLPEVIAWHGHALWEGALTGCMHHTSYAYYTSMSALCARLQPCKWQNSRAEQVVPFNIELKQSLRETQCVRGIYVQINTHCGVGIV